MGLKRLYIAAAVSLIAALSAAGCSSGGSPSSTPGSSASAGSIPIGVIGSFSGPDASFLVGADKTIEAWADTVNATGGIDGHKVRLFVEDDAANAETSVQDARQLVQQDHVAAIVGDFSTEDASWAAYVQSQNIPVIGGGSVHPAFATNPDFFASGADYIDGSYGVVAEAADKGGSKSLGAVYCAEATVCSGIVQLFDVLGKSPNVSVNYQGKVAQGTPDFTALCQAMKAAHSSYYDVSVAPSLIKQIFNQCSSEGIQLPIITLGDLDDTFAADPAFNHLVVVDPSFPFWQDNTPATEAFHAALAKYAPGVGTSSASPLTPIVAQAWTSAKLFEAAADAAGSGPITSSTIKQGLYSLRNETLDGLTGPLNFKQGQANLEHCYFTYTITSEQFTGLNNLKPSCAPAAAIDAAASALTN